MSESKEKGDLHIRLRHFQLYNWELASEYVYLLGYPTNFLFKSWIGKHCFIQKDFGVDISDCFWCNSHNLAWSIMRSSQVRWNLRLKRSSEQESTSAGVHSTMAVSEKKSLNDFFSYFWNMKEMRMIRLRGNGMVVLTENDWRRWTREWSLPPVHVRRK